MNSTQPFVFHLSPYVTGGTANFSFIFLTIFDFNLNSFVFNDGFLSPSTTTVTLPANTLAPGHSFVYEVDFSNRDLVSSPGAQFQAQLGFDLRTDGDFTSAPVPEPATAVLFGLGVLAAAAFRHLRKI